MSDLTPLFKQCVNIVETSINEPSRKNNHQAVINQQYQINDTFLKECLEFRVLLSKLDQFVDEVRTHYLEAQDNTNLNASQSLSVEDKNKIDEDFQIEIQQLFEKLKLLQKYEQQRQTRANTTRSDKSSSGWGISSIFRSDEQDDLELFQATASAHRTQVLKSLNQLTNTVNKKFEKLQRQRHQRERQLNLLDFQNLGDDDEFVLDSASLPEDLDDVPLGGQQLLLTEEQEKSLNAENQDLLTLKTNQFQQVEKLRNSMIDIVNLQTELTFQLESQSEQIENLLDNQGQVEIDVNMGNKSLSKATSRNKTGSRIIITTSIIVAILILFLDYIS